MNTEISKNLVYTIGHSTRSMDELAELLRENNVEWLIDIRAYPGSRTNPQFNKDNLEIEMPDKGMEYDHMRALGGRRKEAATAEQSPNTFWNNKSFQNYADYALSDEFQTALEDLKQRKGCYWNMTDNTTRTLQKETKMISQIFHK